ncbi:MAG: glycosyltransferase family 2 protein [Lachnospiraceae bacterium]|nr:glycosyltransferase family 2 protein [Lachnospiraceae bacterium]
MLDGKKISVAVATYNGEDFIIEQLDSIINQSVKPDEIVVCDDCSSDNTVVILKEYAEKHSIVKVFKNESNLGFIKNFEKAAKLCSGDYILFSDQDDIWTKDHIEILVKNSSEADLVCANAEYMTYDGKLTGKTMKPLYFHQSKDIRIAFRAMIYTHYAQGAVTLIKREMLQKILPFPPKMYHDIWMGFATYLAGGKVKYVPKVILHYRRWGGNVSTINNERLSRMQIVKKIRFLLSDGEVFDQLLVKIKTGIYFIKKYQKTPEKIKSELVQAYWFAYDLTHKKNIKTLKYFIKNHNVIFLTNDRRGMPLRILRYFIFN